MKNLIVFVSFIFMSNFYLIAQKDIKFSASVSENVSFDFPKTGNVYLGTNLQLGISFKQLKTSIVYQFGGLYSYNWSHLYSYNIHMLGVGCEYRLLNYTKKISPTIGIMTATQLSSNFKNGIFNDSYIPYTGSNPDYMYSSYLGTKFLSNVILGCEYRLFKNTYLGLGAGIGVRDIKVKYTSDKIENSWFLTFDSQLKLSYIFQKEL